MKMLVLGFVKLKIFIAIYFGNSHLEVICSAKLSALVSFDHDFS